MGGPVFLAPVILLALAIKAREWREKRRASEEPSRLETALRGDRAIIAVRGPLDSKIASDLEVELADVAARNIPLAILDLRETTSIEEVAITRLMELQEVCARAGVEWALVPAKPSVQVSLELSGLTDLVSALDGREGVGTRSH